MRQVNIHAAKTHLSVLVEQAAAGESFIIAKAGQPMVTVVPYKQTGYNPRIGFLPELSDLPPDFNQMQENEIIALFEGQNENPS